MIPQGGTDDRYLRWRNEKGPYRRGLGVNLVLGYGGAGHLIIIGRIVRLFWHSG